MNSDSIQVVASAFKKALNQHGFAFQYSSIRIADELFTEGTSRWIFQASEFPVDTPNRSKGTRIDFILQSKQSNVYLLFECKRANPAIKNWCFARAPYVRRNRATEYFFVETITSTGQRITAKGMRLRSFEPGGVYHIALEVKGAETGDSEGKGFGAIEEAASQICYGLNGLVELFHTQRVLQSGQSATLVPVILTTASIWTTTADLSEANILTGELQQELKVTPKPWVYFQYHQSPGLKHSFYKPAVDQKEIASVLDRDYIRTIPIVTAAAIGDFLKSFDDDTNDLQETR